MMDLLESCWIYCIVLQSLVVGCLAQSAGDVRLVGGPSAHEGRLEVYYQGEWGTICNQGWDATDSQVVCKQLGFQVSLGSPQYPGSNPQRIWLTNVQCESTDQQIQECITPDQWGQAISCSHLNDVGVRCSGLNVEVAPNYRGCFRITDNPLSKRASKLPSNTIEDCIESCSTDSMFAGVYGTECICDDQIESGVQPIDNSMCKTPCPGNAAQLCGYDIANMELVSIYVVTVGDGYLSSPWFPGNYVTSATDTSQAVDIVSSAIVPTDSGNLLLRILALNLTPTDRLTVEAGDTTLTFNNQSQSEYSLSGLPAMTTLTATLMRAATSAGESGYIIEYGVSPVTTIPLTTTTPPTTTVITTMTPTTTTIAASQTAGTSSGANTGATSGAQQTTQTIAPSLQSGQSGVPDPTASATSATPVACTHPVLENGVILEVKRSRYQVGETVTLDCNDGRNPVENTTLTCQRDETWSPPPACTTSGLALWAIILIPICLVVLIIIFLICIVSFGKRERKREDEDVQPITHIATPSTNDYNGRPPLIPINEASASGLVRQGTNISTASTIGEPERPAPAISNDAVQQTEPVVEHPPSEAGPEPPSPTESYPPRDYPGASGRGDSMIITGMAQSQSNGYVNNLGNEERQAVDQLFDAVRDYDDSPAPAAGLYSAVPPRHLRSGSTLSVISNPGRVTDGRTSPRYSGGNPRSVQFDKPNFRG